MGISIFYFDYRDFEVINSIILVMLIRINFNYQYAWSVLHFINV